MPIEGPVQRDGQQANGPELERMLTHYGTS